MAGPEYFLSHNRNDLTEYINNRGGFLASKGILEGGLVAPSTNTGKVLVAPFVAIGDDGLVVQTDSTYELDAPAGEKRHICLRLKYIARGEPQFVWESLTDVGFAVAPSPQYLIKFAEVTAAGATVINSDIDMVTDRARNDTQPVSRNVFRGSFATSAELPTQTSPETIKAGDAYLIEADQTLWVWDGSSWGNFGSGLYVLTAGGAFTGLVAFNGSLSVPVGQILLMDGEIHQTAAGGSTTLNGGLFTGNGAVAGNINILNGFGLIATGDVTALNHTWGATKTVRRYFGVEQMTPTGPWALAAGISAKDYSTLIVRAAAGGNGWVSAEFRLPVGVTIKGFYAEMFKDLGAAGNSTVYLQSKPYAATPIANGWVDEDSVTAGSMVGYTWIGKTGTLVYDSTKRWRLLIESGNTADSILGAYIDYEITNIEVF